MAAYDVMIGIVLLFAVGICIVVAMVVFNAINTSGLQTVFASETASSTMLPKVQQTLNIFDGIFLLAFIAVGIGGIVSAFLIDTHPLFFFGMILVNIVLIVISMAFGNSYDSFITSGGAITAAANSFPMMNQLIRYLPLASLIGMIVAAVFAAKMKE